MKISYLLLAVALSTLIDTHQNVSQARVATPSIAELTTYSVSYSAQTGVTTVVLFHDPHPPVIFCNELSVPILYGFKDEAKNKPKRGGSNLSIGMLKFDTNTNVNDT